MISILCQHTGFHNTSAFLGACVERHPVLGRFWCARVEHHGMIHIGVVNSSPKINEYRMPLQPHLNPLLAIAGSSLHLERQVGALREQCYQKQKWFVVSGNGDMRCPTSTTTAQSHLEDIPPLAHHVQDVLRQGKTKQ